MTRREMLIRMFGAAAAAAVAPLIDLTDATPAFWNQLPVKALMPWRMEFPDGLCVMFDAEVIAERLLNNGDVEFKVRPLGAMKIEQTEPVARETTEPATLHTDNGFVMKLQEIDLPAIDISDDIDFAMPARCRNITFTGKF
jgi:hypothetical protein